MGLSHANDSEGEGPQLPYTNMHMHLLFEVMAIVVGDMVVGRILSRIFLIGGKNIRVLVCRKIFPWPCPLSPNHTLFGYQTMPT